MKSLRNERVRLPLTFVHLFLFVLVFLRLLVWEKGLPKGTPAGEMRGPVATEITLRSRPSLQGGRQVIKTDLGRIVAPVFPTYRLGDRLRVSGSADAKGRFWYPKLVKVGEENGWLLALWRFREKIEEGIDRSLPEPQASLLNGMLLGVDRLPPRFRDDLRSSGLIHLVVASGTNVSIVAGFMIGLAGWIGRRQALLLALIVVVLYSLMTGLEPPIVRAVLMSGFSFSAELFGRRAWSGWILVGVAVLMVLVKPAYLYQLSFQLSFLAAAGVLFLSRPVLARLEVLPLPGLVKMGAATTLAAQAAVTPRLISAFGQVSLLSPLTNALVLALVEPLMMVGAVVSLLSLFLPHFFAPLLVLLTWAPLTFIVLITRFFGSLSFVLLTLPRVSFFLFIPWYVWLIWWVTARN
jgi:competence protein ComEC